jgi:hypothetical protein
MQGRFGWERAQTDRRGTVQLRRLLFGCTYETAASPRQTGKQTFEAGGGGR